MCKFPSFIIDKKGKVYGDGTIDEHDKIIDKYNLKESADSKTWVRIECEPKDQDIFNTKPSNWAIMVDEQNIPDWFERQRKTLYEPKIFKALKKVLSEMLFLDQEIDVLDGKRFFLKNCKITKVTEGIPIVLYGSSVVQEMYGSSVVQEMHGSSVVQKMCDSSVVQEMYDSSVVQRMHGSSVVQRMHDSSVVQEMYDSSVVQRMHGSSVVQEMYGSSVVQEMYGSSVVQKWSSDAKIETKNDSAVIIDRANRKILVCDKEVTY